MEGDTEAVLAANGAFYAAFNERDTASMNVLWARRAPVSCVHPHGNLITSRNPGDIPAFSKALIDALG